MTEPSRSMQVISALRQAEVSELACQFAALIARDEPDVDPAVMIAAALLSEAVSRGKMYLNLAELPPLPTRLAHFLPDTVAERLARLRASQWVGKVGDVTPMVLNDEGWLYLYRHWHDEQCVTAMVSERLQTTPIEHDARLQHDFADWESTANILDWQKVAVLMAMSRQLSVISGGPGTGKTTVVLALIRCLLHQDKQQKIALAAPTGKAAMRLQQAIADLPHDRISATTIHRLLGITENRENGRYSQQKPLMLDVLIVDEASMIDMGLMKVMMQSLAPSTKLVLIGDSNQLASVESGTVLADLCQHGVAFSAHFQQLLHHMTGIDLPSSYIKPSPLQDSLVLLQHSYRFGHDSLIGQLATAIQQGDAAALLDSLETEAVMWQQQHDIDSYQQQAIVLYQAYVDAVKQGASAEVCLRLFEQSRILCALKQGEASVEAVNLAVERYLNQHGWRTQQRFYLGRPILITQNDYRHRLFNGDTGLVLYRESGQLAACFLTQEGVRWIALNHLPAHDTAFAMTVHKSQGSEFEQVSVILPDHMNPVLDKSLLYTAVTRAKRTVNLVASEAILRQMLLVVE